MEQRAGTFITVRGEEGEKKKKKRITETLKFKYFDFKKWQMLQMFVESALETVSKEQPFVLFSVLYCWYNKKCGYNRTSEVVTNQEP